MGRRAHALNEETTLGAGKRPRGEEATLDPGPEQEGKNAGNAGREREDEE